MYVSVHICISIKLDVFIYIHTYMYLNICINKYIYIQKLHGMHKGYSNKNAVKRT